jgi:hypothetical protein
MTWPTLPYEAIGKATVAVLSAVSIGAIAVGLFSAAAVGWMKFWNRVVNWAWGEYHPADAERPPEWRLKVAFVAYAFSELKRPSNLHENIQKAHRVESSDGQRSGESDEQ